MIKYIPVLMIAILVFATGCTQVPGVTSVSLKQFSSVDEIEEFIKENSQSSGGQFFGGAYQRTAMESADSGAPAAAPLKAGTDYSTTNIQVAGVDEADFVKNDGKYIYTKSGNKIVIVEAYPADTAKILSEIKINGTINEFFVNGDKLVVFGMENYDYSSPLPTDPPIFDEPAQSEPSGISGSSSGAKPAPMATNPNDSGIESAAGERLSIWPYPYYEQKFFVKVYDISDRSNPDLTRNIITEGYYINSRMIGDYVYVVINQNLRYNGDDLVLPAVAENGVEKSLIDRSPIYYFDVPDYSYQVTTIMSLNTQDDLQEAKTSAYLMGGTSTIYVSTENIYVTFAKQIRYDVIMDKVIEKILPLLPASIVEQMDRIRNDDNLRSYEKTQLIQSRLYEYINNLGSEERQNFYQQMEEKTKEVYTEIGKDLYKTGIHKISVNNGNIEYKATGEVPGNILNQFSMDEFEGHFRIATTTDEYYTNNFEDRQRNHVYVLNQDMQVVGKLEDLAPGERIYSSRFIGDRLYLVTFKKIDPLFVIDLSDPASPSILGKLKIPGYSDYLHPYDENHIIGVGKETIESEQGNFAWYQGVKISLFDVTDVNNPIEVAKYNIGDRGTDSYALYDHKAFLFDKSRNLLVLPILLAEINENQYPEGKVPDFSYGNFVWQGAYVFELTPENGFVLKGRVSHQLDNETFDKSGFYYFNSEYDVKRSLYIQDVLYTISEKIIKMNDLSTLNEINSVELPYEQQYYYDYYGWRGGGVVMGSTGIGIAVDATVVQPSK